MTIIKRRRLNAIFVTDDYKARPFAEGFQCVDTWSLISVGLKLGILDRDRVREMRETLLFHKRISRHHRREIYVAQRFEKWLDGLLGDGTSRQ